MDSEINRVAVIGSGTMGSGIALVLAQAKISVNLVDINPQYLNKGFERIEAFLKKSVEREKITKPESQEILSKIKLCRNLNEAIKDVQLVIEAIIENEESKIKLFSELDNICSDDVIFASNTSAISITSLASATNRPTKFLGMHFFNPPQLMKLIEIIRGRDTQESVVERIIVLCKKLGKIAIPSNESPGFIVNRLLWPFLNESYRLLETGVSEKENIDAAVKLGLNHPMGPFELSDYIGLDIMLDIGLYLEQQLGPSYKPANILSDLVTQGKLGKKTKEGFYKYD